MTGYAMGNNAIAGSSIVASITYKYPSAFDLNDLLGASRNWNTGAGQTMASTGYYSVSKGKWFDAVDKYMGLRLHVGASDHYGWLRLDVSDDGRKFTAKDYAYEATAGIPIIAGDVGVGVVSASGNEFTVFAIDKQITIQMNETTPGSVSVFNALGQPVMAEEITSSRQTLNMAEESSGVYFVSVAQNGKVMTRKVVLR